MTPTTKEMGLVRLTLDRGVKTTAIGQLYGLDFEIEGKGSRSAPPESLPWRNSKVSARCWT